MTLLAGAPDDVRDLVSSWGPGRGLHPSFSRPHERHDSAGGATNQDAVPGLRTGEGIVDSNREETTIRRPRDQGINEDLIHLGREEVFHDTLVEQRTDTIGCRLPKGSFFAGPLAGHDAPAGPPATEDETFSVQVGGPAGHAVHGTERPETRPSVPADWVEADQRPAAENAAC